MKNLFITGLLVACLVASQAMFAQQPQPVAKPTDFHKAVSLAELPKRIEFALSIQKIHTFRLADKVSLPMGDSEFTGEIVDKAQPAAGVVSMNIRSINMPGTFCTISIVTDSDHTQKIVGRIFNPHGTEALVLTEENNRYYWVKQELRLLMTD